MTKTIKNKNTSLAVENRHRRRESLLSGVAGAGLAAAAVLSVGATFTASTIDVAQGAIAISDNGSNFQKWDLAGDWSALPAAIKGTSGGGGANASNNGIAFVGDGDCSVFTGDDTYAGVYGDDAAFGGGLYGFGRQTTSATYNINANAGANTAKNIGIQVWTPPAQTFGTGNTLSYLGSATQANNQTQAFGVNSFAVGCNSKALGLSSTAIGLNAQANGTGSVSMGQHSIADAGGTIALGISAKAMAEDAIALGSLSNASVRNAIAIGSNAQATGVGATAFGSTANGSVDAGVLASGAGSTAIGGNTTKGANATGADSVAIAGQSLASGASSVAIGLSSTASGASAISVGNGSTASGAQSIAIGVGNNVSGANSGAIGDPTTITGDGSYSLGNDNTIAGANAGIFGNNGNIGTAGAGARIIGNNGSVNVADGFVLGNSASVTASGGVAIGSSSKASTAAGGIGLDPFTNKASATTGGAWVATNGAVSVGDGSTVTRQITGLAAGTASTDAVNVAQLSKLRDYAAQGWNLTAGGENSTNVGVAGAIDLSAGSTNLLVSKGADNNNVTFDLAKDINITSVTTGNSKLTTSGLAITVGSGATAGTTSLTGTGLSIANGPSVTTTGIDGAGKSATNLANATLSATSTDAVTGQQLFATNTTATTNASRISSYLGGGANVGAGTAPTYSIQGANKSSVGDAFASVDSALDNLNLNALQWNSSLSAFDASYDKDGTGTKTAQKITNVADGELSTTSKDAVNGSQLNTTNTNVSTLDTKVGTYATRTNTFLGGGADIANNKAPSYSIQGTSKTSVGDAFSAVDTAITTNKTNIATNAGNISNLQRDALQWNSTTKAFDASYDSAGTGTKTAQKITNVANGTSANDAVNYSQLQAVQSGSAWNVSANGDATGKTSVGGGATVDFSAGSTNLTVAKSGTNLSFDLAKDISIDSVTTGNTKVSTSGVAIAVGSGATAGTTSLTGTGLTISGGPSITTTGIDNAGKKATNLADATLSATSTDAVTGKQLFATNANVTTVDGRVTTLDTKVGTYATRASTYLGGGADIAAGTAPSFTIQSTAYGNVGAALGAVDTTLTGLKTDALQWNATSSAYDASHGTTSAQKITNVADGTLSATSKDAVNGSQLNTTNANVTAVDGRVTTVDGRVSTLDTKVGTYATRASTYLGGGADIAAGTAPTFAIQGANYNNVNSAFGAVNSTLTTQNTNISALQTDALQWNSASLAYDASHGSGSAQKITNVANGTASSDAVNYGQLTNAINSSAWSLAVGSEAGTAIGNGATVKLLAGSSNLTIARAAGTNDITFDISKNLSLTSVTATGAVTANSLVAGNSTINNNGLTIANGPSVTATGIDAASLKVTNVAAGTLSAASKDAVNGSQLYTTNTNVASNKTAITDLQTNALQWNGTDSFDATRNSAAQKITGVAAGTLSATSTDAVNGAQLNATNTNVSANKTAISGLQTNALQWDGTSAFDATRNNASQKITGVAAGTLSATSTDAVNGAQLNATNANVTTNKNSITALQSDALQWNANLSAYDAGHGTGTAQKITNVADGTLSTTSTDAVNGKQLNTTNTNVTAVGNRVTALDTKVATQANNVSTYLGGGADVAAGVAPTYTIQSASKTSVGDAFSAVDTALTTNKNAIATNKTAITNLQTDALQWNSASGAYDASHGSGTAQKITNVAAGTLSTTSTDAVNGAQLNATNTNVTANKTAIAASNANIANLQANALQWNGTDSFDANRGGAAQKITGVAAGTLSATSTDAVNGAQLNTTNTNVTANKTAITANTNAIGALQTNALQWDGTGAFDATRNGGSQKITGVAAGTLSATSTDAVNGAQLNATNNNVTANKTAITSLQTDALQWNAVSGAYDASHGSGTAQKITNVADGALSTTSTDAVNGKQLNATNTNVTAVGNRVTALDTKVGTYASNVDSYLGGGASVSGGTAPSFTIQGATKNSVGDAFTSVDTALTTNRNAINANKTAITGLQTDALQWNATSGAYDASHGTTSAQKITNVAAGTLSTTSTDAVNGAQLNATNANVTAVGNRVTDVDTRLGTAVSNANKYFGGSTDLAAGTAPSFTIQGNATNNVTSAFGAVDTALTGHGTSIAALQTNALQWNQNLGAYDASYGSNAPQKISNVANGTNTNDAVNLGQLNEQIGQTGWNLSVNNANSTKIGKDATVDLKSGSSNLTIAKATGSNDVTFDIARNLDLDSIQAGNVKLDNTGLVITGGASVTTTGVNAGNQKITNVAQGTAATDAVNFGQLTTTNNNVAANTTAIAANKTAITANTTDITDLKTNALQWNGTDSFDATRNGAAQKITGVAAGTAASDAVNFGQLTTTNNNVAANTTAITTNKNAIATNTTDIAGLKTNALQWDGSGTFDATRNGAAQKITGVANGTAASDAVNFGQLTTTNTNVTNVGNRLTTAVSNTNKYFGGTTDVAGGVAPSFATQNGTANNVTDAFSAVNTSITGQATSIAALQTDALQWSSSLGAYDASHGSNAPQRISNVAAGTSATDAANVGQLTTAISSTGWNLSANGSNASKVGNGGTVDLRAGSSNLTIAKATDSSTVAFDIAKDLDLTSVKTGDATLNTNGLTITGGPSVTKTGIDAGNTKVTNVAAGTAASDAVNFGQLTTTNTNVAANTTAIAANKTAIATNTTDISGLKTNALQWNGTDAFNATRDGTAQKITGVAAGTATGDAVNFDQLSATNTNVAANKTAIAANKTAINANTSDISGLKTNALQWNGTDSFDATRGGAAQKITGVANGTAASDAVNFGQLTTTNTNVTNVTNRLATAVSNTNKYFGGTTDVAGGVAPSFATQNGTANNVTDAFSAVNTSITGQATSIAALQTDALQWNSSLGAYDASHGSGTQKITNVAAGTNNTDAVNVAQLNDKIGQTGWNLTANGANSSKIGNGGTVDLRAGSTNLTVSKTADSNAVSFDIAKDLDLTSVKTGAATLNNDGLTIANGPSVTSTGINAGAKKVTNLADGDVSTTSTDAVTGRQLNTTNTNVAANKTAIAANKTAIEGNTTAITGLQTNALQWNGTDSFDATRNGAAQKITGVAAGTLSGTSTDAVNGAQLNATNTNVTNVQNRVADVDTRLGTAVSNTNKYFGGTTDVAGGVAPSFATQNGTANNVTDAFSAVNTSITGQATSIAALQTDALQWNSSLGAYDASHGSGTQKITNVAAGTNNTDAVNVAQLNDKIGQTGWNLTANGANSSKIGNGGTVDLRAGSTNLTVSKTADSNAVSFDIAKDLDLTSVKTGAATLNNDGLTIANGPSVTSTGINAGAKKVTNLADGDVSTTSTDAVTGRQLNTTNTNVAANKTAIAANKTAIEGNTTAITGLQTNALQWNGTDSFDATRGGAAQKITGVAAGTLSGTSTDAVNGAQLNATNTNVTNVQNRVADVDTRLGTAVSNTNKYFGGTTDVAAGVAPSFKVQGTTYSDATSAFGGVDTSLNSIKNDVASISTDALKWDATTNAFNAQRTDAAGNTSNGKITNVGDATLSATSSDAVTGSQLFATNKEVTANQARIASVADKTSLYLGGGADLASGTAPTYNIGGNSFNNVGSALTAVDSTLTGHGTSIATLQRDAMQWNDGLNAFSASRNGAAQRITNVANGTEATDAVNKSQLDTAVSNSGWNLSTDGQNSTKVGAGDSVDLKSGSNINVSKSANGRDVTFDLAKDITVDSVTATDVAATNVTADSIKAGNTSIDTNGLTIANGPSVTASGINAASKKVTNVADATLSATSKDAVNGSQLFATNSNIDQVAANTSSYLGGGADVKTGQAPSYSVQGGTYDNVGSALGGVDAAFNNVNSQISTINNSALMWSVGEGAYDAARDKGTGTKTNSKITHLQDGTLSADSSDAVTGSQLWKTQQDVNDTSLRLTNIATNTSNYLGGGANVQTGEAPTYKVQGDTYRNVGDAFNGVDTSLTNVQNQIANVNKDALMWDSSLSAYNAARPDATGTSVARRITGVAEGNVNASSTDAVNGSQLNTTNLNVESVTDRVNTVAQNTNKYLGGGADVANGVAPSFNVQGTKYNNVSAAFGGVNANLTDIKDQVASINTDALKWDSDLSAFSAAHDDGTGTKVASKITNVKSGRVAADSTDAVNGSQLFTTNTNIAAVRTTVNDHAERVATYLGGGADIIGGTAPTYNVQGQAYRDVGSAFGGVNSNLTDIKGQIAGINNDALMWDATLGAFSAAHDNGTGTKVASKITNVAAGEVSATSTDAINGSQLFTTNTRVTTIANTTSAALGGGADLANGKAPSYQISSIGSGATTRSASAFGIEAFADGDTVTNFDNVGDALTQLNTNVNTVNTKVENVKATVTDLSNNALVWDETAGAFSANHTKDGVTTKSKITNIADGSLTAGSSDAVTGGQLYSSNSQIASFFGGGAAFTNGTWTAPTFIVSQVSANGTQTNGTYSNVNDAFGGVNSSINNVNQRVTDVQDQINNMGPDGNALRYDETAGGYNAGAKNNQPNKIVNVADGSIAQGSKDAVNGGQLWDTNQRIDSIQTNVNDVANNSVMYDKDASGNKTNSIGLKGADASKPVTINNVADGKIEKGSQQAVNGGQLYDYTKEQAQVTLNESKAYTDQRVDNIVQNSVEQSNYYTDTKFNQLNTSITNARKEARRGAAIGLAAASLRYDDTPGKFSVATGGGFWKSEGALAFGAGYTSETGKVRSNITATTAGGDWGVGAGVSITLN
ncbi:YadA-like family protein [Bartonella sp. HY038]|uniref:YadA-like family protein n=1 Tax=Bartonella sp. HY038 TaxID=2759660 RepID=UPI0015FD5AC5|nr:YadA-like family protein [Bartonella sp. HY038]